VRNRRSERTILCLLHVDVDPLMVTGGVGKCVHHLLGDSDVVAVSEMLADVGFDAVGAFHDGFGHGLVIPDSLVLAALGMEQQRQEGSIERERQQAGAEEAKSKGCPDLRVGNKREDKRRSGGRDRDLPAELPFVGHKKTTHDICGYDQQTEEKAERVALAEVMQHPTAVDEFNESKKCIDVEQPRGDLQRLRLHSIKPFASVEHATSMADRSVKRDAHRICELGRATECRQIQHH